MVIVAFSDLHGHRSLLAPILRKESDVDVVLFAGDITGTGSVMEIESMIAPARQHSPSVFAVAGNCDHPEVEAWLTAEGLSLHRNCRIVAGVVFTGVGSSLPCPDGTPNECGEPDFGEWLAEAFGAVPPDAPTVLLTHEPPFGTVVDRTIGRGHVGSRAIRAHIEKHHPLLCVCGHIHEGAGIDRVGSSWLVNPGPLSRGGYMRAVISGSTVSVEARSYGRT
jgi:hypothetical protein